MLKLNYNVMTNKIIEFLILQKLNLSLNLFSIFRILKIRNPSVLLFI